MRKQHKKYSRPRQLFNSARIKEENELVQKYGLKNKKEIWKADSEVSRLRRKAKNLLKSSPEKQELFTAKLKEKGFNVESLDGILGLNVENLLERRLQTIVFKLRIAHTSKQARQLITHKKISIDKQIINIPSYIVPLNEENKIKLISKEKKEKVKKVEIAEAEKNIEGEEGE